MGEWRTLKESMSCVSNSLSSQVNLYVPVVTTGNVNATNEALTIGRVCPAHKKNMHAVDGGDTTGCIRILWHFSRILLSSEMVPLGKQPVFLDCYRLAFRMVFICKSFAAMYDMTVFNAVQCEWGTGNHQVEGVPNVRVGVRCEHRHIVSQLSHQKFRLCSWNVGATMRGQSYEVVEVMCRHKVEICGL